jgi:hypothetical protein
MNILMLVGQHVGQIGILTAQACGHKVIAVVPYNEDCEGAAHSLGIPVFESIKHLEFVGSPSAAHIVPIKAGGYPLEIHALVSVHGREIIPADILGRFKPELRWNVHPYLDTHPGTDPVGKALASDDWNPLRVHAHILEPEVDSGRVLDYVSRDAGLTAAGADVLDRQMVYSLLYPLYTALLIRMFTRLDNAATDHL